MAIFKRSLLISSLFSTLAFATACEDPPEPTIEDSGVVADSGTRTDAGPVDTGIVGFDITAEPLSITLVEGGAAQTFNVSLTEPPPIEIIVHLDSADLTAATVSPASLTFNADNYNTPQAITVTAVQDNDTRAEITQINLSVSDRPETASVTVNVTDDDTQALVVTPTAITVGETASGSFDVSLAFEPDGDVSVTLASADTTVATVGAASLTFTPANYATTQAVTVSGVDDLDTIQDSTTVTVSSSGLTDATVTVTVTDDDAPGIVAAPTTLSIDEGDTATVAVSLSFQPTSDVTVTVASANAGVADATPATLTFTSGNWDVPQSVFVATFQDVDTRDDATNVALSSTGLPSIVIAVTVVDDDTQAIVALPPSLILDEGATATVAVTLAYAPEADVTITALLSDGTAAGVLPASLTFTPLDYNTPQYLTVSGSQDDDLRTELLDLTLSSAGLVDVTVSLTVIDDDTQSLLVNPGSITVDEQGSSQLGVTLAYEPDADVTVSLVSSDAAVADVASPTLTFTTTNWNVEQQVAVTGTDDADTTDGAANIALSAPGTADVVVPVVVVDNDILNISINPASLNLTEGGPNGSFTVRLTQAPAAPLVVNIASSDAGAASVDTNSITFTAADYNVARTVLVTPVTDDDTVAEAATIDVSAIGLIPRTVTVTVAEDDVQALVVVPTTVALNEGQIGGVMVSLAFNPLATVTVNVVSADAGAVLPGAALTFNAGNYATPQLLSLTAVQDDDLVDENVIVTLSSAVALPVPVTVSVDDDDVQALVVVPTTLLVPEGGNNTFSVALAFRPAAATVVSLASSDAGAATALPLTLNFAPGTFNVAQNVTVAGVQDVDLADENVTVAVTTPGVTGVNVAVTVDDDDIQAFVLSNNALTLLEGANQNVTLALAFQPAANVTVNVNSADAAAVGAAPGTLTFTPGNYATAQPIAISAVQDNDTRNENVLVTISAAGVPVNATVTVTVTDDDVQALVLSTNAITVAEEGAAQPLGVSLAFEPNANVTVNLTPADATRLGVVPGALTFTVGNYALVQNVNVSGLADVDLANHVINLAVSTAVAPTQNVTVTVNDNDTQALILNVNTLAVTEDILPRAFTVRLAFQPAANVVVSALSSDSSAVTVFPPSRTFTPANYDVARSFTVAGATDPDQLDTGGVITVSAPGALPQIVTVTVTDDDDQRIVVDRANIAIGEGDQDLFNVNLAFLPLTPNENLTIALNVPGEVILAPLALNFTQLNYFMPQPVTIDVPDDLDLLDVQVIATLTSDNPLTPPVTVVIDVNDDDTQAIVFAPPVLNLFEDDGKGGETGQFDTALTFDPTTPIDITATSLDTGAVTVTPPARTFTTTDYTDNQIFTVEAVSDDDVQDESVSVRLSSVGALNQIVTVNVQDDDNQEIILSTGAVTVAEGGATPITVRLRYRPLNPVTVSISIDDPAVATLSTNSLVFNSVNFANTQTVNVRGTQDNNLDDQIFANGTGALVTFTTGALAPPEGAPDVTATVDVTDDDAQVIVVETVPTTLPTSVQEDGPTATFRVSLLFPPRGFLGASDDVFVTPSDGARLDLDPPQLTFFDVNFDTPQTITVSGLDDADAAEEALIAILASDNEPAVTNVPVRVVDDEQTVIDAVTFNQYSGGTQFTKRQNIRWGSTLLSIAAYDNGTGATVGLTQTRELDDLNQGPSYVASRAGVTNPVESIELDPNANQFGFFMSDTAGIRFVRASEDLAQTFVSAVIVGPDAVDFWPVWNGNGYGLLYRSAAAGNLFFRTVSLAGVVSAPAQVTVADASTDFHPNLHFNGAGYTVLYSQASEVRCVRLGANGIPIGGSNVILPGFAGGAFVATAFDGTDLVATFVDPTAGIEVTRVDPSNCTVGVSGVVLRGPDTYSSTPPSIDWNGFEFVIGYDLTQLGVDTVGVLNVNPLLHTRGDTPIGDGRRPSVTWAGDRWVIRHEDSVVLTSGSFQSATPHCNNSEWDADEASTDCGGNDCLPCTFFDQGSGSGQPN